LEKSKKRITQHEQDIRMATNRNSAQKRRLQRMLEEAMEEVDQPRE
jgi:hypothetical protein